MKYCQEQNGGYTCQLLSRHKGKHRVEVKVPFLLEWDKQGQRLIL